VAVKANRLSIPLLSWLYDVKLDLLSTKFFLFGVLLGKAICPVANFVEHRTEREQNRSGGARRQELRDRTPGRYGCVGRAGHSRVIANRVTSGGIRGRESPHSRQGRSESNLGAGSVVVADLPFRAGDRHREERTAGDQSRANLFLPFYFTGVCRAIRRLRAAAWDYLDTLVRPSGIRPITASHTGGVHSWRGRMTLS
jgi:hypothetical protein